MARGRVPDESRKILQDQAIALYVSGEKITDSEVARRIGVSRQVVSNWRNKDRQFQERLKTAQFRLLQSHVKDAINTMVELLDARSEHVRFEAASDILTRCGFDPVDKQEVSVNLPTFVDDLKETLKGKDDVDE